MFNISQSNSVQQWVSKSVEKLLSFSIVRFSFSCLELKEANSKPDPVLQSYFYLHLFIFSSRSLFIPLSISSPPGLFPPPPLPEITFDLSLKNVPHVGAPFEIRQQFCNGNIWVYIALMDFSLMDLSCHRFLLWCSPRWNSRDSCDFNFGGDLYGLLGKSPTTHRQI